MIPFLRTVSNKCWNTAHPTTNHVAAGDVLAASPTTSSLSPFHLRTNAPRQQGRSPLATLRPALFCDSWTVTFMNKLEIIILLFLFMPPNHCYSSTAADSRCLHPVKWQRVPQRSAGSVSCSSLNTHKGSSVEPERFTDGRPPDVGSSAEQIKAKRSLCLLTGWIEMLQILKNH